MNDENIKLNIKLLADDLQKVYDDVCNIIPKHIFNKSDTKINNYVKVNLYILFFNEYSNMIEKILTIDEKLLFNDLINHLKTDILNNVNMGVILKEEDNLKK